MTARRRQAGWFSNPTLIGALTVLIAVIGVTLAYEANSGLPFVPTYELNVQVPNANEVGHNADVRIGGHLVGFVDSVTAARGPNGTPIAKLRLKLALSVKPLPVDTTFTIRLKAAIGLKYLQVVPGHSTQTFADGATVPVGQARSEVDLDQFLSMFDAPTRAGVQSSTAGFGYGLAGRGPDLNDAIGAFGPLLTDLAPVARNLSSSETQLGPFLAALQRFTGALVPVAQTQATLFGNLNTTFGALAQVARPYLQETISQSPPTFDTVAADAPKLQPFLTDAAGLFKDLQPGVNALGTTAPVLASALTAGIRNLPPSAKLDDQLVSLSGKLASYGQTPAVQAGLDRLTLTASAARPPLSFLAPVQSVCNYATLFLKNTSSLLSQNTATGTSLRFVIVAINQAQDGEGGPSRTPYESTTTSGIGALHVNPYPNTASPGQTRECEAGNEPYLQRAVLGNVPGNQGVKTSVTTRSGK